LALCGVYDWKDIVPVAETVAPHRQAFDAFSQAISDLYGRSLATWYAAERGVAPPEDVLPADKVKLAQDTARAWLKTEKDSFEAQAVLQPPRLPEFKDGEPVTLSQVYEIKREFCNTHFVYENLQSLCKIADESQDEAKCRVLERMMLALLFVEVYEYHTRHDEMFGRITTKALCDAWPRLNGSVDSKTSKGDKGSFLGDCTLERVKSFVEERFGLDAPNGRLLMHAVQMELGVAKEKCIKLHPGDLRGGYHVPSAKIDRIWLSCGPTTDAYKIDAGLVAQHVLTSTRGWNATIAMVAAVDSKEASESAIKTIQPLVLRMLADTCYRLLLPAIGEKAVTAAVDAGDHGDYTGKLLAPGIGDKMTRDLYGYDNVDICAYYQCTIDHVEDYHPLYKVAWRLAQQSS
jgi:hypothetical protein